MPDFADGRPRHGRCLNEGVQLLQSALKFNPLAFHRRLQHYRHLRVSRVDGWVNFILPRSLQTGQWNPHLQLPVKNRPFSQARTAGYALLEQQGYRVIRFWNDEVFTNIEEVLEMIQLKLE